MSEPVVRLVRNPILIAQARRRLRPAQLLSSTLIFGLLGICGVLLSVVAKDRHEAFSSFEYVLLTGIGGLLLLRGSNRVAETVREERESGILDFHRATPTTPWTDGIGYLLGCPAREYLMAGILAGFALACATASQFGLLPVLGSLVAIGTSGLLYHCFALWIGLSVAHKRGASGIVMGTLVVLLIGGWSARGVGAVSYFTPYPALFWLLSSKEAKITEVTFYGLPMHALVLTLLVQGSVLLAMGTAVARKLRQDDATSFSRLGTLAFFAWIAFLSLGAAWQWISPASGGPLSVTASTDTAVIAGYLLVSTIAAAALLIGQVPSYLSLLRALRRARRLKSATISWLDEGGRCEPLTLGLWGLTVAGLLAIHHAMGVTRVSGPLLGTPLLLAAAAALCYLLFVQTATEFVRIRHRGATSAVAVFVFFASHVLPFLLSFVFGASKATPGLLVMAASPIYGVWAAAAHLTEAWLPSVQDKTEPLSIYVSLAVSLAVSAFFFIESRRSQADLARRIADSTKPS